MTAVRRRRSVAHRIFVRLRHVLGRLAARNLELALRIADAAALLRRPLRSHPVSQFRRAFPQLSLSEARVLRGHVLAMEIRNHVAFEMSNAGGIVPPETLVLPAGLEARLRSGCVLVSFHAGPFRFLETAAQRAGVVLHSVAPDASRELAPRMLHDAIRAMRLGQAPLFLADGAGDRLAVPFGEHEITLARGAFALARMSGAPIVPLLIVWRGLRAHVLPGPELDPPRSKGGTLGESLAIETGLATRVAEWLSGHLQQAPQDVSLAVLRRIRPRTVGPFSSRTEPAPPPRDGHS